MPVQSGMLKQRVTIRSAPSGRNTYGEKVDKTDLSNWGTVETVYADVSEKSASELRIADADASKVYHVVKLRWRDDFGAGDESLTAAHSLVHNGRWLDIKGVRNGGMNNREFLIAICEEKST